MALLKIEGFLAFYSLALKYSCDLLITVTLQGHHQRLHRLQDKFLRDDVEKPLLGDFLLVYGSMHLDLDVSHIPALPRHLQLLDSAGREAISHPGEGLHTPASVGELKLPLARTLAEEGAQVDARLERRVAHDRTAGAFGAQEHGEIDSTLEYNVQLVLELVAVIQECRHGEREGLLGKNHGRARLHVESSLLLRLGTTTIKTFKNVTLWTPSNRAPPLGTVRWPHDI